MAILAGAGGAIGLRVLFTWLLAYLLDVPLLSFLGGLLLVWIAMKLLQEEEEEQRVRHAESMFEAIWTIILADFVMSLDNMLAVAGAAGEHPWLILFGLFLSIAFIMTASGVIADWMNRWPVLVLAGAGVLAWTAGRMLLSDAKAAELFVRCTHLCVSSGWDESVAGWNAGPSVSVHHAHWSGWVFLAGMVVFVTTFPWWGAWFRSPRRLDAEPAPDTPAKTAGSAATPGEQAAPDDSGLARELE
jgi:YjbE family integral membrane protein